MQLFENICLSLLHISNDMFTNIHITPNLVPDILLHYLPTFIQSHKGLNKYISTICSTPKFFVASFKPLHAVLDPAVSDLGPFWGATPLGSLHMPSYLDKLFFKCNCGHVYVFMEGLKACAALEIDSFIEG